MLTEVCEDQESKSVELTNKEWSREEIVEKGGRAVL